MRRVVITLVTVVAVIASGLVIGVIAAVRKPLPDTAGTVSQTVNVAAGGIGTVKLSSKAGAGLYYLSVESTKGMSKEPYYVDFQSHNKTAACP